MNILTKEQILQQEPRLVECICFVEATSTESHKIWCESAEESPYKNWIDTIDWTQAAYNKVVNIGSISMIEDAKIKVEPIQLMLSIHTLNGKPVCFFEPWGRYADFHMMTEAMKLFAGPDIRVMVDAANFYNCIRYIKELKN